MSSKGAYMPASLPTSKRGRGLYAFQSVSASFERGVAYMPTSLSKRDMASMSAALESMVYMSASYCKEGVAFVPASSSEAVIQLMQCSYSWF